MNFFLNDIFYYAFSSVEKLYWCDNGFDSIESAKVDGTKRQVLYQDTTYQSTPWSLALYCNNVMWTDETKQRLLSMPKDGRSLPIEVGNSNFVKPRGMYIHQQLDLCPGRNTKLVLYM